MRRVKSKRPALRWPLFYSTGSTSEPRLHYKGDDRIRHPKAGAPYRMDDVGMQARKERRVRYHPLVATRGRRFGGAVGTAAFVAHASEMN